MSNAAVAPSDARIARHDRGLIGTLAAGATIYGGLAWLMRLPALLERGRVTIGTLTNRSTGGALLIVALILMLYALYILGAWRLWCRSNGRSPLAIIWIGGGIVSLLLLWAYPTTSTDLFDYIVRGRISVVWGGNPYLDLPNQFKSDPVYRYVGWPNAPSAYGPLWEALSALLTIASGGSLLRAVLIYKLVAIGAYLGCGLLIQALLSGDRRQALGVYLWLWSPLALWELAAAGHNDGLLVLALLLALWAARRGSYPLAILALTGGALFKFLPAIFLPLVVLRWLRDRPRWRDRAAIVAAAITLAALPTIVLYAPYWDLPTNFASLGLVERALAIFDGRTTTLRNMAVREGFLNAAPLATISYLLQSPGLATINGLLGMLGRAATDAKGVRAGVSTLGTLLLGLGLIWQCWRVWRHDRELRVAFFGLLCWYLIAGSQWFQPWYVLWPLAVAVIRPDRATVRWLTAWALAAQLSYVLQYTVLPRLKISGQSLGAQTIYLVLIFVPPLIVWLIDRRRKQRSAPGGESLPQPRR